MQNVQFGQLREWICDPKMAAYQSEKLVSSPVRPVYPGVFTQRFFVDKRVNQATAESMVRFRTDAYLIRFEDGGSVEVPVEVIDKLSRLVNSVNFDPFSV